ncbi:alpha-amylase [Aspergillus flavus AF70]|nr:alpha-amylase [Aspergillus flavus AF70]
MNSSGNGYDIYDLYDLGEFDQKGSRTTKWGSRRELEDLVEEAKSLGVGVYWDAVLNHKAGADYPERFQAVKVDPNRRNVEISKPTEIEGWVGFDFAGRGDQYSSMKYNWQHFNGVDWDESRRENAIFKIHAPGKDWAQDVGKDNGNYDYLMFANLDYSNPEVREDVLNWGTWITNELSLSGMRLDAAKHFSAGFQKEFIEHVRKTANKDLFVIGEYWSGNLKDLLGYLQQLDHSVTAVDVPLVVNLCRTSYTKGGDLRKIFKGTLVQSKPENALTFVSNHDTVSGHCIPSMMDCTNNIKVPGQMLENPVAQYFKPLAYALVLLRKDGHPCVFYGDLYGTLGDKPLKRACKGKLPILTRARKLYAYGEQQDYFDQANCIGFVRYGNARHPSGMACIMSNGAAAEKRMYVGPKHANEQWTDIMQSHESVVTIDASGYGVFPVNGMSVSVWVNSAAPDRDILHQPFDDKIYE